jgi:hypothetical protein
LSLSQSGHAITDTGAAQAKAAEQRMPPTTEVFRSKNARVLGPAAEMELAEQFAIAASVDRLTVRQGELMSHLDEALNKVLSSVIEQKGPTHTAIGSASQQPPPDIESTKIAEEAARIIDLGKLKATKLENGDVSYMLPLDSIRATAANLIGYDREAFREVGVQRGKPHIEVMGQTDRQIGAAMAFAKQRWAGDAVIIHADDKHVNRIVEHAVRAGLNIDTSRDPQMASLVTRERERQANPILREQKSAVPTLERVPAGPRQAR